MSSPPSDEQRGRAPEALVLFWISLAVTVVWGFSSELGTRSLLHRAIGVIAAACLVADAALLVFGIRDSTNRTVQWLRRGGESYLSTRPPFYWRLYGALFAFLGVIILEVTLR